MVKVNGKTSQGIYVSQGSKQARYDETDVARLGNVKKRFVGISRLVKHVGLFS
jgi:hypothetical protein